MKKKYSITASLFIATIALLFACRHELPFPVDNGTGTGGGNPLPVASCHPDSVYFVNQILPIISSNCTMSGCHDNITHADGVNLTSYTQIMKYVRAGDAADSKLYKVIIKTGSDRMPPPPMPALTATQKSLIQKWINQGAKNNSCIGACDTTVFTYSGAVKPIMDAKCSGCHNLSNLGGNIDVSTYNGIKIVAQNGKLYGSVAHQAGYSPMPKNAAKLSDCEIRQIQKWVAAGILNN
jgi:uncharacterized membrane protein